MATLYCATPGCGRATDYTVSKPMVCPKCQQPFSAAFKKIQANLVEDTSVIHPVHTPPQPRKVISVRPPPPRIRDQIQASGPSYMVPLDGSDLPGFIPPESTDEDADSFVDDGPVDKDEVSIYAAELQASLDPNTIRVDFGDQPIRLHSIIPPEARR